MLRSLKVQGGLVGFSRYVVEGLGFLASENTCVVQSLSFGPYSKLLKEGYIGDYIGDYYRGY